MQDTLIPQLVEKAGAGSDLDIRVISAYLNQCTGNSSVWSKLNCKFLCTLPLLT